MPWSRSSIPPKKIGCARRSTRSGAQGIRVIAGLAAEHESRRAVTTASILSPGIDPAVPLVQNFLQRRIEMIGELELAYEMCKCPIIGITGTNGKTTTTQLVETMLNGCGVKTVAARQHRPRLFRQGARRAAALDRDDAGGQLLPARDDPPLPLRNRRLARASRPITSTATARWRSTTRPRSASSKTRRADDWAVVNFRDKLPAAAGAEDHLQRLSRRAAISSCATASSISAASACSPWPRRNLRGSHNAENLMAALGVGFVRGLSFAQMRAAALRLQAAAAPLRNPAHASMASSGSTTPRAPIPIRWKRRSHSETRPVVLIAGGKDKGFEYDSLTELVRGELPRRGRASARWPTASRRIWSARAARVQCRALAGRGRASSRAAAAQPGDVVLFSPGTSSFDMFKNYADRGNQFRALVQALPPPATQHL